MPAVAPRSQRLGPQGWLPEAVKPAASVQRLRPPLPGIRLSMLALVYKSYDAATTVGAFVVAALIVLAVGLYFQRRK